MKVILFGGSGMVGQGALRECLLDPGVEEVLAVGRRPLGQKHRKLRELVTPNLADCASLADRLTGYDACFYCLGVSSVGMEEAAYTQVTYELTMTIATTLVRVNPGMRFVFISGAGADSNEAGRVMWARVKGRTENALRRLPFASVHSIRPGVIQPLHGIRSRTRLYSALYTVLSPVLTLARRVAPRAVVTTEVLGKAMLALGRGAPASPVVEMAEIDRLGRLSH